jgi:hypothetical protein
MFLIQIWTDFMKFQFKIICFYTTVGFIFYSQNFRFFVEYMT